jgi:hypothetical protein
MTRFVLTLEDVGAEGDPPAEVRLRAAGRGVPMRNWMTSTVATGTNSGYVTVHNAARKTLGKVCVRCGATGRLQAALRHDADPARLRLEPAHGLLYSTDPANDYHALCPRCHSRLDVVEPCTHCPHGHPYSPENTHVRPNGKRDCRTCHRLRMRRRYASLTPEQRARRAGLARLRRAAQRRPA